MRRQKTAVSQVPGGEFCRPQVPVAVNNSLKGCFLFKWHARSRCVGLLGRKFHSNCSFRKLFSILSAGLELPVLFFVQFHSFSTLASKTFATRAVKRGCSALFPARSLFATKCAPALPIAAGSFCVRCAAPLLDFSIHRHSLDMKLVSCCTGQKCLSIIDRKF